MSNSNLVDYVRISPNSNPRTNKIQKIQIHHMAGNLTVEQCGNVFQTREASTQYGIDGTGRVGLYVDESRRAWSSGSPTYDHQSVTMELANSGGAPDWKVADATIAKAIELCVDICQRNGMKELTWTGDLSGSLIVHRMATATTCPGEYLMSKMAYIAKEVTARLQGSIADTNEPVNNAGLYYSTHVSEIGDTEAVHDGMISGTVGKGLPVEAFKIDMRECSYNNRGQLKLNVKVHIANEGWKLYKDVSHDTLIGTTGEAQWIEAIELELEGLSATKTLKYQVHLSDTGWTGIIENGFTAGTVGIAKKIEAIKIWIDNV